jgi:hypothetical protein
MPFSDVSWDDDELVLSSKLQKMSSNIRYLYDSMPKILFSPFGIRKTTGIKIACGTIPFGPNHAQEISKQVYFGTYFNNTCKPVVVVTHAGTRRAHVMIGGLAAGSVMPDHRGFRFYISADPRQPTQNNFPHIQYLNWIAVGF